MTLNRIESKTQDPPCVNETQIVTRKYLVMKIFPFNCKQNSQNTRDTEIQEEKIQIIV